MGMIQSGGRESSTRGVGSTASEMSQGLRVVCLASHSQCLGLLKLLSSVPIAHFSQGQSSSAPAVTAASSSGVTPGNKQDWCRTAQPCWGTGLTQTTPQTHQNKDL